MRWRAERDEKDRILAEREHVRRALERDYKIRGDDALSDAGFTIIEPASERPPGEDCQVYLFGHTDKKGLQSLAKIRRSGKFHNVQTAVFSRDIDVGSLTRKGDIAIFARSGGWVQHVGMVVEDGGMIRSKMSLEGSVTEGTAEMFPYEYGDYVEYWRQTDIEVLTPACDPYDPYVLTNDDLMSYPY